MTTIIGIIAVVLLLLVAVALVRSCQDTDTGERVVAPPEDVRGAPGVAE